MQKEKYILSNHWD